MVTDASAPSDGRPETPVLTPERVGTDARVTRLLSSAIHLNAWFADLVVSRLLHPEHAAWAPCWGTDARRLAEHALWAKQRRTERDAQLLRLLLTGTSVQVVLAIATALHILSLRHFTALTGALLIVAWICAWYLVTIYYTSTYRLARDVFLGAQTAQPDEADTAYSEFVGEGPADGCNTVVFRDRNPFADSGEQIRSWILKVHLDRPLTDEAGNERQVRTFNVSELYADLVAGMAGTFSDIHCAQRLYVSGTEAAMVDDLLYRSRHSGFVRPRANVTPDVLVRFADRPVDEHARTYICFEKVLWQGELVLTLIVRAHDEGKMLFLEADIRLLLPLGEPFRVGQWLVGDQHVNHFALERQAARMAASLLLRSPRRLLRSQTSARSQRRRLDWQRDILRQGLPFSYEPENSVRTEAADDEIAKYFAHVDTRVQIQRIEEVLLAQFTDFLRRHNIDPSEASDQIKVIVNETHINNVSNSAINTASRGSASNQTQPSGR